MLSNEKEKAIEVFVLNPESTQAMEAIPKSIFYINKKMLRYKIHFFLFEGAVATTLPYMSIFAMNRIGLSATSFGSMMTVQQFLFIITKPLLGYIADYLHKLKMMIAALIIIQSIFYFMILTVPKIERQTILNDERDLNLSFLQICLKSNNYFECFNDIYWDNISLHLNSSSLENYPQFNRLEYSICKSSLSLYNESSIYFNDDSTDSRKCKNINCEKLTNICDMYCIGIEECCIYCNRTSNGSVRVFDQKSDFKTYQFWLFSFLFTMAMICTNGLYTLSDAACCETISSTGSAYGRQKLFGSLGWGVMVTISGYLNDYTHDYLIGFSVLGIFFILTLLNLKNMSLIMPNISQNILKDVSMVLKSPEYFSYTLFVFLIGMGSGVVWFYLVWFLTKIGASIFLCGLSNFVQCFLGEIPFMFFSDWLIKKLGHFMVLTLTMLAFGFRFLWYSQLYNPWLVLPVEVLQGVTFGVLYSSIASYAKLNAKPGTEATSQAILFTAHEGLGAGLGCLIFGVSFDAFGEHMTFFVASMGAFVAAAVSFLLNCWVRHRKKNNDL